MKIAKTHSPKVQQKRKVKIDHMLDVSMKIILEDGMSGLTMRKLANALGITPGALYRYFPSKGKIIGDLGNRILSGYAKAMLDGVIEAESCFPEAPSDIRSLFYVLVIDKKYMDLSFHSYDSYRLLNMIMIDQERYMTEESDYSLFMGTAKQLLELTAQKFHMAMTSGVLEPNPPLNCAMGLLSVMNGNLQLRKFSEEMPDLFELSGLHRHMLSTYLKGLGADPANISAAFELLDQMEEQKG